MKNIVNFCIFVVLMGYLFADDGDYLLTVFEFEEGVGYS